jgi:reverse gyrase
VNISLGIEWRDYQKEFPRFITSEEAVGTVTAVKAPRQVGKTTVLMAVLLYYGCTYKNGFSILIEPTYKQCIRVYNEMRSAFEPILTDSGKSQLVLEFKTGSKVQFLSGESDIASFQG